MSTLGVKINTDLPGPQCKNGSHVFMWWAKNTGERVPSGTVCVCGESRISYKGMTAPVNLGKGNAG